MGVRLIVETPFISKDQGMFGNSKNCTESVCVNIPQLKFSGSEYRDDNLNANYQA